VTALPLLPAAGVSPAALHCVGACPLSEISVEVCCFVRPFTLLQRRAALRSVSAAGSTLLAYIFATILILFRDPVRICFTSCPFSLPSIRTSELLPRRHSPPGFLGPSGSLHSARLDPENLPLPTARSAFAPRCAGRNFHYAPRIITPASLLLA